MSAASAMYSSAADASSVRALIERASARLAAAGVEAPRREARLLLAAAMQVEQAALLARPDRPVDPDAAQRFAAFIERRAAREPVSRILGTREFWSLPFRLSPATLDPRPDSETLIEAALAGIADRQAKLRLLDLGTGSGCLLLALLSELPNASGIGVDCDPAAVAAAEANAEALGLAARAMFRVADWAGGITERFNLVVANPPYVPDDEIAALAPEVARFDPPGALAGGADGLEAYRRLAPTLARILAADGRAVLELGAGQLRSVKSILKCAGLEILGARRDLNGVDRCLVAGLGSAKK